MHQSGFKGEFPDFLKFLRDDPQFYAKTPQELLIAPPGLRKYSMAKSSQYFGYLRGCGSPSNLSRPISRPFYTSGRGGPGIIS